jgi:cell filamentation protein
MDEAERVALKAATDKLLGVYDAEHRFTADDIRTMHKLWLGDIYEWAGEYRQVNVRKDDFNFAASRHIPQLIQAFEKDVLRSHTPCNFKSPKRVIKALAQVHVELVLIHPFREGNGRISRLLAILMALQAGLPPLDFTEIVAKRKRNYISAVQTGLDRDYGPMEEIFESVIRKTLKAREQQ